MTPDGTPDWWTTRDDNRLASDARALFATHFGDSAHCEGVWAAPGRVNLIGEHVDYAGGMSLPFALPQNTAAAVGRRTDGLLRLVSVPAGVASAQVTDVVEVSLDDVGPGQPDGWAGYAAGAVWAGLQDGVIPTCDGLDIALVSDVPLGAGLSSSAAWSVPLRWPPSSWPRSVHRRPTSCQPWWRRACVRRMRSSVPRPVALTSAVPSTGAPAPPWPSTSSVTRWRRSRAISPQSACHC
ncbi:galactokinase family protein [Corynebacterium sp. CNJ-954]|uniref:galactokinase family protein n=1 Tax=Corynebacterium sp. CNJ-954 TaxID=1904962 RepID=UPI00350F9018